jgi:hypothetical protein
MNARILLSALAAVAVAATGVTIASCPPGGVTEAMVQRAYLSVPGYAEPHTPGSGVVGTEMAPATRVQQILGPTPTLNRVSYARFWLPKPDPNAKPRTIFVLVPGFISGAGPFGPLARQLVAQFNGNVEVWVIDRRPNQLEDRRGLEHAKAALQQPTPDVNGFYEGLQFYFPETLSTDIDQDGTIDPPYLLPDALGGMSSWVKLRQNDARFMAYWGVDTYVRDWKILVEAARAVVGPQGLVLFGGHSMGTTWASVFAAYDFDPGPGVDAGYSHIDGILLLEGGGVGAGSATKPTLAEYQATVNNLATATVNTVQVFLPSFFGVLDLATLGAGAGMAGLDGVYRAGQPSLLQRTTLYVGSLIGLIYPPLLASETLIGLFLDEDHSPAAALAGSFGMSDDGDNQDFTSAPLVTTPIYQPLDRADELPRQWKNFDDPTLPTCPPNDPVAVAGGSRGCAIRNNGPRPAPTDPARQWGEEREVSDLYDMLAVQYERGDFIEQYFASGRPNLDFQFGRDSSSLGDESLLAITQNANVNVPVLCLGGSNGLAPSEKSYATYLGSIATPASDQEIFISEGYAHLDVLTAKRNAALPTLTSWVNRLLQRKLLAGF